MSRLLAIVKVADLCGSRILGLFVALVISLPLWIPGLLWVTVFLTCFLAFFVVFALALGVGCVVMCIGVPLYVISLSLIGVTSVVSTGTLRWSRAWSLWWRDRDVESFVFDTLLDHICGDLILDGVVERLMDLAEAVCGWYAPAFRPAEALWERSRQRRSELAP
jgi:hypothetical protein